MSEPKQRLVAFISHQLFSRGDYKSNVSNIEKIAEELYGWGVVPIMPQLIVPFTIKNGKETDREKALECCLSVLAKCDFMVFEIGKMSEGVKAEFKFAQDNDIPVMEINYLRSCWNAKKGKTIV